jgi:hypothetical protein
LRLSYLWYKHKEDIKKLKINCQLHKCEFKKRPTKTREILSDEHTDLTENAVLSVADFNIMVASSLQSQKLNVENYSTTSLPKYGPPITAADSTNDDGDDFELILEGHPENLILALKLLKNMEDRLTHCSTLIMFRRAVWEFLRLRQQEYNNDNLISLNLLPNRVSNAIRVTIVTTHENVKNAHILMDSYANVIYETRKANDFGEDIKFENIVKIVSEHKNSISKNYKVQICLDKKEQTGYFHFIYICLFIFK